MTVIWMSCETALYMSANSCAAGRDIAQHVGALAARQARSRLEGGKTALQVLDQVLDVFNPDRQSQHAVAYADRGALLGGEPLMCRRRRVGDQALRVAEIVGNVDDFQRIGEGEGRRLTADDIECDQCSAAGHLPARQLDLGVIGAEGVE